MGRFLRLARHRLRSLFRSGAMDDELERELALHVEALVREQMAAGLGEEAARLAARRAFGPPDLARDRCRDARRVGLIEDLVKDTRYAIRVLARSPGFALAAIVSLALGLGVNTAIVTLVDGVLLRTLPVHRPGELVFLEVSGSAHQGGAPPYPCVERIRAGAPALAGLAAFSSDDLRVEVDGGIEQVFGQVASGNYFEVLGVRPVAGRLMTAADEQLNPAVAVIGYGYWQRRFGGDPAAIGRTIVFRDRAFTIVGVTPPEFHGLQPGRRVDLTLPITQERAMLEDAGAWWLEAVARVAPGAGPGQAAAQADTVFQSFMNENRRVSPEARTTHFGRLVLSPGARGLDGLRERFSTPLSVMAAIGAIVLLIACANLGSLLLARGEARSREMAIRVATGAGSGRLLRQLLTETLLIFLIGAAAGLLVAHATVQALAAFFAVGRTPILLDLRYDWRIAALALGTALAAGLLTGLWPARRALSTDPLAAMKEAEGRLAGSSRSAAASRLVIAGQMALSLVLLVAAVLFARTMAGLRAVDLGFRGSRVLTMSIDVALPPDVPAGARRPFHRQLLDRVRALPGVDAASLSVLTPLSGRDTGRSIRVAGYEPRTDDERTIRLNHVSEDYFRTFGIAVVAGRAFTPQDAEGALPVAIVNEAAAETYFAGRSPIGETIALGDRASYRVVGVVRNHKHRSLREPAPRFAFVPLWQPVVGIGRVSLAIASDRAATELARAVGSEVRQVHARSLISDVIDVERQIDATLLGERLLAWLAAGFAALALVLACVGLYGTLTYSVARRRSELGIRMALGARPSQVASAVMRQVLPPLALGIVAGLPPSLWVARSAGEMLYGVTPLDATTYAAAAATLAAVALGASWAPARRAASIPPVEAIRAQ